jgi:hypothetical protein
MEKTNTNNYNTPYSKVYNFKNFNADTEIKDLGKTKRSFVKNYDDVYELPNNKKMYFNKVTKTMQSLSKDEIDDKIEAAEEYKEDEKSNENKSKIETDENLDIENLKKGLNSLLDAIENRSKKFQKDPSKAFVKQIDKEIRNLLKKL